MRRNFLTMAGMMICLLVIFNFSWSACPEAPNDLGNCDTLHVVPFPTTDTCIIYAYPNADPPHTDTICINNPGEKFPCFLYVNLLVTHDSNSFWWQGCNDGAGCWTRDSIAAIIVPLGWTRTNKAKYCSLTTYWNENTVDDDPEEPGYPYPRRIWRNFPPLGSDSINLMDKLKWSVMVVDLSSDSVVADGTPPHAFMSLLAQTKKKWRQEKDTLLATLTFRIQDTMHVCIDTTFWPPGSHLQFIRYDAAPYIPRSNLPLCIWVGPPQIQVLSPNGGDTLCVGSTKDITWLSEKFTDPVKIEYSTNGGQNWIQIEASTPNDGVHPWTIPDSISNSCRVKVSDAADGEPKDSSDATFTIIGETIAVTYPIGGEFFVAGDPLSITWNSACFIGSVDILMSEDGGSGWNPIVSGTENDGIHPALISQSVATNQGLIQVLDSDNGIPSDQSDGFFTVRNFSIRTESETLVVSAGEDTSCKVILESQFGFNLPCTLTVSEDSLPANTTYELDTLTVVPTDTAILTFHTESLTPSCTSHVIVTGAKISGAKNQLEHSTEVILIVTGLPPDFSIDASPDTLKVPRGYSGDYKVVLTSINNFASNCTLTVTGDDYPAGATATFEHPVLVPTDSSLLTLTIPGNAVLDTFTLTITAAETGKGKGIAHSKNVTLIVTLPTWSFEVDAFPDTQIISQGGSTAYDVTIIPNLGFSASCSLFVQFVGGLPSGVTADFDSNPIPPNDTSTLTINTLLSTPPDTYDLAIIAVANIKWKDTTYVKLIIEQATDVDEEGDQPNAPDKFALFQNQPNPFNPETKISYYLPEGCEVKLIIYNILGRRVKTLFEGHQNAGVKTLVWDGKNDQGEQLSSGIYFYRLQAGEFIQTKKMNLLK